MKPLQIMVDKLPTSTGEFTGFQPSTVLSNWLIFQPAMFGFPVAYVNLYCGGGVLSQETTSCLTTDPATNFLVGRAQQIIWKFPKNNGTPQISHSNKVFHYKPSILGYPYFWKPPYTSTYSTKMSLVELWGLAPSSASGFQQKKNAISSLP